MRPFHLSIEYKGKHIEGEALPVNHPAEQGVPLVHRLIIEGKDRGFIRCTKRSWEADQIQDEKLVEKIGSYITAWYE